MNIESLNGIGWDWPAADTLVSAMAAAVAIVLILMLALWARAVWAAWRPVRQMIARLERLTGDLERAPANIAPLTPAEHRSDMEDRLLLLEARGQGDSPRARALRRRLGMVG